MPPLPTRSRLLAPCLVTALAGACGTKGASSPNAEPLPASASIDILAEAERYLNDADFRRAQLEASLTSRDNLYAKRRLTNYGLVDRGWDLLPPWNPRARMLGVGPGARPSPRGDFEPVWNGQRPQTREQWRELGERVFFRFPLRAEPELAWAVSSPERAAEFGLAPTADGTWLGVVEFESFEPGQPPAVGITCALCHVDEAGGQSVVGRARRSFDYGRVRVAYRRATGRAIDPESAARMHAWGPGRADVSDDTDADPISIPDLWGLRDLEFLTQAGTLTHLGPTTLAIRQETQILYASRQRVRPPRELAFALAVYLYTLQPPERPRPHDADTGRVRRGAQLFATHCSGCHSGPARSGALVAVERVKSSAAMTRGHARGTGAYRPAPLIDVEHAAPYLHDASVSSLEALLDPVRVERGYPKDAHPFGSQLAFEEREALIAYVRTL